MVGVSDLAVLLRGMEPVLHDAPYGFGAGFAAGAFATVAEDEGPTVVAEIALLRTAGIAVTEKWARISLTVHSDLAAVGLTAALTQALAADGITGNVIAGLFHDHIFVPWERRDAAMEALKALSRLA